jgi:hypothetical protein
VDYLDQFQAHSGHTHVHICYTQCLLTILFYPSTPYDGISAPHDGFSGSLVIDLVASMMDLMAKAIQKLSIKKILSSK